MRDAVRSFVLGGSAVMILFVLVFIIVPAVPAFAVAQQEQSSVDQAAEVARVQKLADDLLPKVSRATGIAIKHPVKVDVITKKQVQEYMLKLIDIEYPGDAMQRQADTLALFGLLERGYNLRQGLVDLMTEQAAAFYDPRTKTYYGISDLPPMMKNPMMEQTIAAHELTHALQDQAVDLLPLQQKYRDDGDRGYALSALMEGMASVIMTTAITGAQIEKLPDLGATMRASMTMMANTPEMQVLAKSPAYLRETLVSPYAEGATFVQTWAKANPGRPVADLFERMPASAEQILHAQKYLDNDIPHRIELKAASALFPEGWEPYFHNTLGEFDLRVLCAENAETKAVANAVAEGWDGLAFAAFRSGEELVVIGTSVWDSETDALEFAQAFDTLLAKVHGVDGRAVSQQGTRVSFVAGLLRDLPVSAILNALATAPAVEEN